MQNPDGTLRTYHYEDTNFPNALTGETDEKGNRIRTWAYDASGRAVLSTFGDSLSSIERNEIVYHPDGSATSLDPLQNSVDHTFTNIHGISKFNSVSGVCTSCSNSTETTSYDKRGNRNIVTDFNGGISDYDYTSDNLLQKASYAVGTGSQTEISYNWDLAVRKPSEIIESGQTTSYTYNARGQVLSRTVTDAATLAERRWAYTYFELPSQAPLIGQLQSMDGPRTDVSDLTTYEYYTTDHPSGDYLTGDLKATINALGHRTGYLIYDGNGRPLETEDANQVLTVLTYHPRGWISTQTIHGNTTSFSYDEAGNLTQTTQPDGSYIDYQYDDVHRLIAISDNLGNRMQYTLDAAGNQISDKTYDAAGVLRRQLSRVYDSLNRFEKFIDGNGDETLFAYDGNGNLTGKVDANLNTTSYEYDALNRLAKTIDASLGETLMTYGDRGNLVSITDPLGNSTQYVYDGLNAQTQLDSPDTGSTNFEYDPTGNRTATVDANGIRAEYFYDALNRLIHISYPDNTLDVTFTYDVGNNATGRLSSMSDAVGTVDYVYDERGNLIFETRNINSRQYITSYVYNAANRLLSTSYPSGLMIDYTLDATGRITAISTASETVLSNVQYAPFGPATSFTYGNGLTYAATFNQDYELERLQSGSGLDWLLSRDSVGNIVTIADQVSSQSNQVFTYDQLYQLQSAQGSNSFEYDANGNRTQLLNAVESNAYTYQPQSNRLATQGGWTFTRDARGNRTQKLDAGGNGQLLTYADHNRLSQISHRDASGDVVVKTYQYDGRGQRVSKLGDGDDIHYIYGSSGELLGEYSALADGEIKEYVYFNGQAAVVITRRTEMVTPPGEELILDNGDAGTSSTGSWQSKSNNQDFGANYMYAGKASNRSYRWTAATPGTNYQVYAWWVDKKNQSADVSYTIGYGMGETENVVKNQKTGGGQWQFLGSYYSSDGQDYVEVSSASNKFVADAIRWLEINDPIKSVIETTHYIHFDHLGTPRQVTDDSQTIVWRWDSTPFGNSAANENPDGDSELFVMNLRFPGQYYDAESGPTITTSEPMIPASAGISRVTQLGLPVDVILSPIQLSIQ